MGLAGAALLGQRANDTELSRSLATGDHPSVVHLWDSSRAAGLRILLYPWDNNHFIELYRRCCNFYKIKYQKIIDCPYKAIVKIYSPRCLITTWLHEWECKHINIHPNTDIHILSAYRMRRYLCVYAYISLHTPTWSHFNMNRDVRVRLPSE